METDDVYTNLLIYSSGHCHPDVFNLSVPAALKVYSILRKEGTQKNVVELMQTREELYEYFGYHEYEKN